MSEDNVATRLAVHKAAHTEGCEHANKRLGRIGVVRAAIVLLLLTGEGSIIALLRGMLGG